MPIRSDAGVAQLVERNLAKVEVESSRLFSRSKFEGKQQLPFFLAIIQARFQPIGNAVSAQLALILGADAQDPRRGSKAVMHRIANPCRSVRLRHAPPPPPPLTVNTCRLARVVKLVDTRDLKSLSSNGIRVRLPSRAPETSIGCDSRQGSARKARDRCDAWRLRAISKRRTTIRAMQEPPGRGPLATSR